jgi:hypothetical protein
VSVTSAIRLSNNNNYIVEDVNHLTTCKPPSKDHLNYSKLLECLKICIKVNDIGFNFWNYVCSSNLIANITSFHLNCMSIFLGYYPLFDFRFFLGNFDKKKTLHLCHLCHVMRWRWKMKQRP